MCSGGYTITSKAKINVFWNFFINLLASTEPLCSKFFQKTLILAFEANSALSQNYTFFRIWAHCVNFICYHIINSWIMFFRFVPKCFLNFGMVVFYFWFEATWIMEVAIFQVEHWPNFISEAVLRLRKSTRDLVTWVTSCIK